VAENVETAKVEAEAKRKAPARLVAELARRLGPYAPALCVSALIGLICARSIQGLAGEPAAPLDDTFIHFQFARRLAEGHFYSYVPGEGYVSGATSFLWPILLAPFHRFGLHGVSLLYAAWLLGTLAHAAVAVETFRVAERIAGRAAAVGAAAMCLLFGAFAWFAWSGMETVPLAWVLMRTVRASAAFCEPHPRRPSPGAGELVALGLLAPLIRPEGALGSLIAAVALGFAPRASARHPRLRARAALPLLGPFIVPVLHLIFTGHTTSSTAMVKWLLENPTYDGVKLRAAVASNVHLLFTSILDGGEWTTIFLPERSCLVLILGAVALPFAAARRRLPFHAVFIALVALGTLIPCTYLSFLWNRVRYIWPFAGAWFVLIACLAREAGDLARFIRPRLTFITPLLAGGFAGALLVRLPWSIHDLAQSAHAIARQQVALGRWAAENLPADARIGVNDTGAIAYLSGRRTFDVVGLTTEGEARYWVAGAGSRYEHYEALPKERLPTHFIVYPHWMACPPVLGKALTEATVLDQSILGGVTMVVYEARYDTLGSGALPEEPPPGLALVDALDVADLASEEAHGYDTQGAPEQDNQVLSSSSEVDGDRAVKGPGVSDGGRLNRSRDHFIVRLPEGRPIRMVMRVAAEDPVELSIEAAEREVATVGVPAGSWVERAVDLPAAAGPTAISVSARLPGGETSGDAPRFHAFHYWFYAR
jgi:hypothetical protein